MISLLTTFDCEKTAVALRLLYFFKEGDGSRSTKNCHMVSRKTLALWSTPAIGSSEAASIASARYFSCSEVHAPPRPIFSVRADSAVGRERVEGHSAVRTPVLRSRGICFRRNFLLRQISSNLCALHHSRYVSDTIRIRFYRVSSRIRHESQRIVS
jgi:hypothetical protein